MGSRWTVPAVGLAVAAVLVVVAIGSLRDSGGDDESAATTTTTEAVSELEALCRENRAALEATVPAIAGISTRVAEAQTSEELVALAAESEQVSGEALDGLAALQARISELAVPPEQVADRDELVAALGEVVFALGAFSSQAVGVLATGDPAAVVAFVPEANGAVQRIAVLEQEVAAVALRLDAPSCSAAGADPTATTTTALTPQTVVPQ